MKIISQHWGFEGMAPQAPLILGAIERAGRTCYQTLDKQLLGPDFVRMLISRGHESVLEHASASVRIVTDRGVTHELVRHRIGMAYSQESTRYCVAGNTKLTTKNPHHQLTVKQLFAKKACTTNGAWQRIKIKQFNERTQQLQYSTIDDVFYVGKKPTLIIKTKLGYNICATHDHPIYCGNGYVEAGNLVIGQKIAVNGTKALYKNKQWLARQYITLKKTSTQIAKEFGFSESVIKAWARRFSLTYKKPASYWNKGRAPWNKGLKPDDDSRVATQAKALKKYHWNEGRYTNKTPKQRIKKLSRSNYKRLVGCTCTICGITRGLQMHHIDENNKNNKPTNLITVCYACHARIHAKNLETIYLDEIITIKQAPSIDVYDISMPRGMPKNFIANGIVVHNCNYSHDKFDNCITFIRPVWFEAINSDDLQAVAAYQHWEQACRNAENAYFDLLATGQTAQMARAVLPNSLKTEIVVTGNMRAWRHFFKLRAAPAAHPQMQALALQMLHRFTVHVPGVFDDIAKQYGNTLG